MSRRKGESFWRKHVAAWRRSGLTGRAYAEREQLKPGTLSWWSWQLGKRDSERAASEVRSQALTFVEVSAPAPDVPFEVDLPSTVRVRVPTAFNAVALERLLDVLERRS